MPWRLPRWAAITLPVAVTLKRFLAPDLVFSLGIWLSCCRNTKAPVKGVRSAEMLVRALKMLGYFVSATTSTGIDTAALDQPGDEVALMAEPSQIGNMNAGTAMPWCITYAIS